MDIVSIPESEGSNNDETLVLPTKHIPLRVSTPDLPRGNMDQYADEWARGYTTFDDVEEECAEEQRELVRAAKLYVQSVAERDRELCEVDWLHGLFTNYDECEMDEKVENLVEFVEHMYDLEDDPNRIVEAKKRRFIRESFHYVLQSNYIALKQMLALIIIAREHDIQKTLYQCTRRDHVEPLLEELPGLASAVTNVPFNLTNAEYLSLIHI